jgi:hypothetical protein
MSRVCSDNILSIPIASQVLFPPLNPNDLLQVHSQFSSQSFIVGILAFIFAICAARLILHWLLHFVAFRFLKAITVTSLKSWGFSPFSYMLLISSSLV